MNNYSKIIYNKLIPFLSPEVIGVNYVRISSTLFAMRFTYILKFFMYKKNGIFLN